MKDIMNLALVNYQTVWGDKEANLKRIAGFCEEAGKRGADMIVFPETALTGYGNDAGKEWKDKMHVKLAEPIPGPSTEILAVYAKEYRMYIIVGMAELGEDGKIYNSAAIIHPDGKAESYRKLHLPFDECEWAVPGDKPVLIETEWGPIGVSICYDTYCFPELTRYYRSMGARMSLNVTACPDAPCTSGSYKIALPGLAFINYMYIATANIAGPEHGAFFHGGSAVIGPSKNGGEVETYLGIPYPEAGCDRAGMHFGTIDLGLVDLYGQIPVFARNAEGKRDWRGDLYAKMFLESEAEFKK